MIRQESRDAAPFIEEEISEAVLDHLGWRAEGRVQRPIFIRGGVLADQVGYGKTAITLGLIDCTSKFVKKEFAKRDRMPGKIPVKGTLIVVPPHLTNNGIQKSRSSLDPTSRSWLSPLCRISIVPKLKTFKMPI
jgi:hypothetical protein